MAKYFNNNLRYVRKLKKISQQTLADKTGIDRSTISRIENGEIDTTLENALKLVDVLNMPYHVFFGTDLSIKDNEHDQAIKELETKSGVKISYGKKGELTAEDVIEIAKLVDEQPKKDDK